MIYSTLFPRIHKYVNKYEGIYNFNQIEMIIKNNNLEIRGSNMYIYKLLVEDLIKGFINNLRNSPYTFNEFSKIYKLGKVSLKIINGISNFSNTLKSTKV